MTRSASRQGGLSRLHLSRLEITTNSSGRWNIGQQNAVFDNIPVAVSAEVHKLISAGNNMRRGRDMPPRSPSRSLDSMNGSDTAPKKPRRVGSVEDLQRKNKTLLTTKGTSTVVADSTAKSVKEPATILIENGYSVKLCGSKDTWSHIQNNFYRPTSCTSCLAELCVVKDAEYVLCLQCRMVSKSEHFESTGEITVGGCGVGFTLSDLQAWENNGGV